MIYRAELEDDTLKFAMTSGQIIEVSATQALAAPDLLSALVHLAGLFESLHPNAAQWGDYKAARAAIAKAKGDL